MLLPPEPNTRDLLPPLLACLPTSFVSSRAPPALLPLLSPLLRQRVTYLSNTTSDDGWLSLLSWDPQQAVRLPAVVERMDLEPHPVSGELELEETRPAKYRRLDNETLQSRVELEQFDLLPIFVWCESDEHGGTDPGWKLAELRTLEDSNDDVDEWFDSASEANAAVQNDAVANLGATTASSEPAKQAQSQDEEEGDDDDYWASYDRTPGRTPAQEDLTGAPRLTTRNQPDSDYYDRYATEVQPAMDAHDPDEATPDLGHSSLAGDVFVPRGPPLDASGNLEPPRLESPLIPAYARHPKPQDSGFATSVRNSVQNEDNNNSNNGGLSMPRPISPASSLGSVEHLEERAAAMAGSDRAQLGIKQHISTDIKSLFRLARSAGMARDEFERIVRTELECLSIFEQDD